MTTNPDGRDLPYTLDVADENISETLGRPSGFAEAVRHLADVRDASKQLKARRDQVWKQIKALQRGETPRVVQAASGGGGWVLRPSTTARKVERRVYSEAVKQANPALWRRCLAPKPLVQVKVPKDHLPADLGLRMPALPYRNASPAALLEAYKSPLYVDQLRDLGEQEADAKGALDKLAAEIGWEGEQYRFTDGYRVQLVQWAFDPEKLRVTDPETWERLAQEVETGGTTTLKLLDLNHAIATGAVDSVPLDEIDGD